MTRLPTDPDARHELLVRYAMGDLASAEADLLEAEFARDPAWAAEAEALREAFASIGTTTVAAPPPSLRDRVLAAAVEEAPAAASSARPDARLPAPTPRGRWLRRAALAAVAASLLVAIGLDELRLRRELALLREVTDTLHAPNVVVSFALRGTGRASDAYGQAILDLDAKKAALVVRELPELPEGQSYWLWAMVGDVAIPCGRFEAGEDAHVVRQLAIPVQEYTEPVRQLLVTVESGDVTRPTGPQVMISG